MSIGQAGERIAVQYIESLGWKVLQCNVAMLPYGEIDIICRDLEGTLVFLEVKTIRQSGAGYKAEDHANPAKLKRMRNVAQMFSAKHPELISEHGWRIDLMAITVSGGEEEDVLTYNSEDVLIMLYENVAAS